METLTFVKEIHPTTPPSWIKKDPPLVDVCEEDEVAQLADNLPKIANTPLSQLDECYALCNGNPSTDNSC